MICDDDEGATPGDPGAFVEIVRLFLPQSVGENMEIEPKG